MDQKELLIDAWKEVFPHSHIHALVILGSLSFVARLGKGPEEWANGISHNDPLSYHGRFIGDAFQEDSVAVLVKPPEGSHLYCDLERMRRVTLHDVTRAKLVARFKKLREFLIERRDRIKPGPFNLAEKLGVTS